MIRVVGMGATMVRVHAEPIASKVTVGDE